MGAGVSFSPRKTGVVEKGFSSISPSPSPLEDSACPDAPTNIEPVFIREPAVIEPAFFREPAVIEPVFIREPAVLSAYAYAPCPRKVLVPRAETFLGANQHFCENQPLLRTK